MFPWLGKGRLTDAGEAGWGDASSGIIERADREEWNVWLYYNLRTGIKGKRFTEIPCILLRFMQDSQGEIWESWADDIDI